MDKNLTYFLEQVKNIFRKDKLERELQEVEAECLLQPQDFRLKIRLGELYFKKRDLQKGITLFREVAEAFIQESFFLKAIAVYKNIIRMAPGSVEFNEKLAELYSQLGMQQDSINQYLIVIHFYQNRNEREKVLETAKKMVQVDPQDVQNRMRLAEIYYNQGLQEEALKEYEKIGSELKGQGGKQLGLLIDVLEKIFFRRSKDKNLLKEICILSLKNHKPETVLKKIEKYKLTEEEDFKKIHEKAREMLEYDQQKEKDVKPT